MEENLPPPPPPTMEIQTSNKTESMSTKASNDKSGSILYLAGFQLDDVHEWISKNRKIVLFTNNQLRDLLKSDFGAYKRYSHVEAFENYANGEVEYKAQLLHKKFNFEYVKLKKKKKNFKKISSKI